MLRVRLKSSSVEVINATCPICDNSQNEAVLHICKATIKTQCCWPRAEALTLPQHAVDVTFSACSDAPHLQSYHQDIMLWANSSSVEVIAMTYCKRDASQEQHCSPGAALLPICKAIIKTQCCGPRAAALKSSTQHAPYVMSPRMKQCSTSAKPQPRRNVEGREQQY